MAVSINSAYISQFSGNLHLLLEQKGSKTRGVFPVEMAKGEKHFFDRLGSLQVEEITGRNQPVVPQDAPHSRRMATVKRYAADVTFDDLDKLQMMIDPTSDYAVKLANAHGKNFDEVIFGALLGTAATGKDGTGSQAFDTTNQQIAHGSTGLTVAKLDQALRILQANEVDITVDDVFLFVNARGYEDIISDTSNRAVSGDFQMGRPLAGKGVLGYRGLNLVLCERMPDSTSGSVFRAIMCTRDALKIAMTQDMDVRVDERPDLHHSLQLSAYMMFGAVRMEEARVVDILFQ